MTPVRLLLLSLVLMLIVSTLYGCGWRLRGSSNLDVSLPPMQLQFQQGSANLKRELRQSLVSAGVSLNSDAERVLVIHGESQGRRVLSVDSSGKVSEYELQYELSYSLQSGQGKDLISNDRIKQQRDYQFDESAVLAMGEEERRLFDFMRRMSIQSLMRRLQTVVLQQADTAVAPESPAVLETPVTPVDAD
jgi:LPS-assembly lipoprotein